VTFEDQSHQIGKPVRCDLTFREPLSRPFIIPQADEGAIIQVPGVRPFDESDLAEQLWFDPTAFLHFLCG
jgi:hypothetical protein